QQHVFDAYTNVDTLQDLLAQPGKAHAMFVAGRTAEGAAAKTSDETCKHELKRALQPKLIDYGIKVEKTDRGYFNITSDRMLIEPAGAEAILREFNDGVQPVLVYLANYIKASKDGKEAKIPYSTIAAVDFVKE